MKPPQFEYHAPRDLAAAIDLRERYGADARIIAGGQSLVPLLCLRRTRPAALIDLNSIDQLAHVRTGEDAVVIGAMTRHGVIEKDATIGRRLPLLRAAVQLVGHPHVRNRGTLGGSIANADPAAELCAVALALRAELELTRSGHRARTCPAEEFFVGRCVTAAEPNEILTEVRFPIPSVRTGWSITEVSRRHNDFALAGAVALVTLDDDGVCSAIRLVLFGVADTPVACGTVEQALVGCRPDIEAITSATGGVGDVISPIDDLHASAEYREEVARVVARRALAEAVARARVAERSAPDV